MFGINSLIGAGGVNPSSIPGLQLWIDSETGVSGTTNGALDSITDQSGQGRTMSNTSGAGSRPVWADTNTGAAAFTFKNGMKHGIYCEAGGDWLNTTGLDTTATPFTLPTGLSIFHTTRHTNTDAVATANTINTPLNILGTNGSTFTVFSAVGFSAGTPQYITWEGSAYITYSGAATTLNDNIAHTVCWTHSGTTLNCYVDGLLNNTQITATYQSTNGFNAVGAGSGNTDGFQGGIAEVMVWNAPISAVQVSQLHSRARNLWI